jgi:hypothetical protein
MVSNRRSRRNKTVWFPFDAIVIGQVRLDEEM